MQEEQEPSFFKESRQQLEQYVQDRVLLLKLQTVEKVSQLLAMVFTGVTLALIAFFVLTFLSIMAGYYFASITGSLYIGFGIVSLFYICMFVIIVMLRKKVIEKHIVDAVIKIFMDKSDSDDDN